MGKRFLVIGLGRFGEAIAQAIWKSRAEVIVLDASSSAIDAAKGRTSAAFVGDATDARVLEAIGAEQIDVAVVTFGEDFEAAVLCVASLRKMGVREIVARATTPRQADVLRTVGATRVVQVETEMGARLAADLVTPVAPDLLDFAHGYRVVPWAASGALVGKTLAEAELRKRFEVHVLGVRARGTAGAKLEPPSPVYRIAEGDTLMLVGAEGTIARFIRESA